MSTYGWILAPGSPAPPEPPYRMASADESLDAGTMTVRYEMQDGDRRGGWVVCRYIRPTIVEVVTEEITKPDDMCRVFRDTGERRLIYGGTVTP